MDALCSTHKKHLQIHQEKILLVLSSFGTSHQKAKQGIHHCYALPPCEADFHVRREENHRTLSFI